MSPMTTSDVKKNNKQALLRHIYKNESSQQQVLCELLHLSRPTVINLIRECSEEGLIEKSGYYESTGGRKANAIVFIPDSKISIGVELLQDSYEITAIDLYGNTICTAWYEIGFVNEDSYFRNICNSITHFINGNKIDHKKILGVGIVLQGLISADGTTVTYGKILNCTGLHISVFTDHLPYPCKFFHDAEAAAQFELWSHPSLKDFIYLNIRSHLSGALIVNRSSLKGTDLKSGVFEHMTLIPNGRPCYCGRRGCMETYCSTQPLIDVTGHLHTFFEELRKGNRTCQECWNTYLLNLATAINNLRMFIDYPVLIGGTLSPYLTEEDIDTLHRYASEKSAFPTEQRFIRQGQNQKALRCEGAAISYVKEYLHEIMNL